MNSQILSHGIIYVICECVKLQQGWVAGGTWWAALQQLVLLKTVLINVEKERALHPCHVYHWTWANPVYAIACSWRYHLEFVLYCLIGSWFLYLKARIYLWKATWGISCETLSATQGVLALWSRRPWCAECDQTCSVTSVLKNWNVLSILLYLAIAWAWQGIFLDNYHADKTWKSIMSLS